MLLPVIQIFFQDTAFDQRRVHLQEAAFVFEIDILLTGHRGILERGRHLEGFYETIVVWIIVIVVLLRIQYLHHFQHFRIGKFGSNDSAHIAVGRCRVTPDDAVQSHQRPVFLIDTSTHTRGGIIRQGTRNQVRAVVSIRIGISGIHGAALVGFIFLQECSAHQGSGLQEQASALNGLAVGHHTVAHMGALRHNGATAHGSGIAGTGVRLGISILQEDAVHDGGADQFADVHVFISGGIHKGDGMISVHLRRVQGSLFYRAQTGLQGHRFAGSKIFAVSAFQNHSFGHHIRIASRVVGVAQRIGMIDKRIHSRVITGHPHIHLSLPCGQNGRQFSRCQQNLLQLHGTGRFRGRSAASQSASVLGHIVSQLAGTALTGCAVKDISFILTLKGSHIYGTVLDTVRILCVIVRNDHSFDIVSTGIDGRRTC